MRTLLPSWLLIGFDEVGTPLIGLMSFLDNFELVFGLLVGCEFTTEVL